MQVKVPVNYRQSFKWVANYDALSLALTGVGGMLGMKIVMQGAMPLPERLALAVLVAGLGAALGLGRWPIEYGDSAVDWIRRLMEYRGRGHVWRAFRALAVQEAVRDSARYDAEGGEAA
ncbi:MAG: hypothetical protein K6V73_06370 [Firmicutes bacterium]|nr:hypothetical protein [Bacillota bacterium]